MLSKKKLLDVRRVSSLPDTFLIRNTVYLFVYFQTELPLFGICNKCSLHYIFIGWTRDDLILMKYSFLFYNCNFSWVDPPFTLLLN